MGSFGVYGSLRSFSCFVSQCDNRTRRLQPLAFAMRDTAMILHRCGSMCTPTHEELHITGTTLLLTLKMAHESCEILRTGDLDFPMQTKQPANIFLASPFSIPHNTPQEKKAKVHNHRSTNLRRKIDDGAIPIEKENTNLLV
jgi:hypothetical protein